MSLASLKEALKKREEAYHKDYGQMENIQATIERRGTKIQALEEELDQLDQVDLLLKQVSEYARNHAKEFVELLVTRCIQGVFGKDLSFAIHLEELRGRPAARFEIIEKIQDQAQAYDPVEARGGGLVDMISIFLRLAFFFNVSPKMQGPMILDEPAKHLSDDYIYSFANFLKAISQDQEVQILMITHNDHFSYMADRLFTIRHQGQESEVRLALDKEEGEG